MTKLKTATKLYPRDAVVSLIANAGAFVVIVGGYCVIVPMIVFLTEPVDPSTTTDLVLTGGVLILFWSGVFLVPRTVRALFQIARGEARNAAPKSAADTTTRRRNDESGRDVATLPERIAAE